MEWIFLNKEWLFSGAAFFLISSLFCLLKRKNVRTKTNIAINKGIVVGGDAKKNNIIIK